MDTSLQAKLVFSLSVDCAPGEPAGYINGGYLFVIPITGGTFSGDGMGEGIRGHILPCGADYSTRFGPDAPDVVESSHICADYRIQTDDGVVICVHNEGRRQWKPEAQTKIVTMPRFQTPPGKYEWLNYGVYGGTLAPRQGGGGVELQIFRLA